LSRWLALASALLASLLVQPVHAQDPGQVLNDAQAAAHSTLYNFEILAPQGNRADVPVNGLVSLNLVFRDLSHDDSASVVAGSPAPGDRALGHVVSWDVIPQGEPDNGWSVFPPSGIVSFGGQETTVQVPFAVTAQARHPFYPVLVVAHVRTSDGYMASLNVSMLGYSLGANSFSAQVPSSLQLHPREIANAQVKLTNLAIGPRSFDMEVADNPCKMGVATQSNNLVLGKSEAYYNVTVQAPGSKLYYLGDSCTVALIVSPSGNKDIQQRVFVAVQVSGWYVDPTWVFDAVFLLLLLLLLLVLLKRRKERVEEEILGKPQKPWTIPVEALYLKALRQKDERAWYVVRHYLMEDEYRSALLWYRSYKKSTRGDRKKERLVVVQERGYERWKAAWRKDIDRPLRKADRYEAQLQRKLDRKARKAHRGQVGKYRKVMRKMEAAHAKQVERAGNRHAKEAARAAKKGLPVPKRPVVPEPDYPEEPRPAPLALADHKWSRKAAKHRARMVRRQGDLEVKFEKADARRLRKVRRKVARLARKLDDPEFVKEHPLLQGS
jgi:hypothetical protein